EQNDYKNPEGSSFYQILQSEAQKMNKQQHPLLMTSPHSRNSSLNTNNNCDTNQLSKSYKNRVPDRRLINITNNNNNNNNNNFEQIYFNTTPHPRITNTSTFEESQFSEFYPELQLEINSSTTQQKSLNYPLQQPLILTTTQQQ